MGKFKDLDYLDLQTLSFIGGQLAQEEPRFQKYAKLGFEKARQAAGIECLKIYFKWKEGLKNKTPTLDNLLELSAKFVEELGISELMPTLKELTRITMIQGNKTKNVSYRKRKT